MKKVILKKTLITNQKKMKTGKRYAKEVFIYMFIAVGIIMRSNPVMPHCHQKCITDSKSHCILLFPNINLKVDKKHLTSATTSHDNLHCL